MKLHVLRSTRTFGCHLSCSPLQAKPTNHVTLSLNLQCDQELLLTCALIDSRACGNVVLIHFVHDNKLLVTSEPSPVSVYLIDGSKPIVTQPYLRKW